MDFTSFDRHRNSQLHRALTLPLPTWNQTRDSAFGRQLICYVYCVALCKDCALWTPSETRLLCLLIKLHLSLESYLAWFTNHGRSGCVQPSSILQFFALKPEPLACFQQVDIKFTRKRYNRKDTRCYYRFLQCDEVFRRRGLHRVAL